MTTDGNGTGDEDVKRRVRFDADADLRLLQAVARRQPFAADHGTKLKAWDDVADEVYTTAAKLRDVPSSRRAVTDRFNHLIQRYDQGALKLKRWRDTPGGDEKAALVQSLFQEITAVMADSRGKVRPRKSTSRASLSSLTDETPDVSRKRSASYADDEENAVEAESASENIEKTPINTTVRLPSSDNDAKEGHEEQATPVVETPSKAAISTVAPAQSPTQIEAPALPRKAVELEEMLALKREKLSLKRQKLELLRQQHDERMAFDRQRLSLERQRLEVEQKRMELELKARGGASALL